MGKQRASSRPKAAPGPGAPGRARGSRNAVPTKAPASPAKEVNASSVDIIAPDTTLSVNLYATMVFFENAPESGLNDFAKLFPIESGEGARGTFRVELAWKDAKRLLDWFKLGLERDALASLEFPTSLTKEDRAFIHRCAEKSRGKPVLGTVSSGVGDHRNIVVLREGFKPANELVLTKDEEHRSLCLYRWAKEKDIIVSRDEAREIVKTGNFSDPALKALYDEKSREQKAIIDVCRAIDQDRIDDLKIILEENPEVVQRGGCELMNGVAPIHVAAAQGKLEALRLLVQAKAPLEVLDGGNQTALQLARRYDHCEAEGILLQAGATDPDKDRDPGLPGITAPLPVEGQSEAKDQGDGLERLDSVQKEGPSHKEGPSLTATGEEEPASPNNKELPADHVEARNGGKEQPPPTFDGEARGGEVEEQHMTSVQGKGNDGEDDKQPPPASEGGTSGGEVEEQHPPAVQRDPIDGEDQEQHPPAVQGKVNDGEDQEQHPPAVQGKACPSSGKGPEAGPPSTAAEASNSLLRQTPSAPHKEADAKGNGPAILAPAGAEENSRSPTAHHEAGGRGRGAPSYEGDTAPVVDASEPGSHPQSNGSYKGDAPSAVTSAGDGSITDTAHGVPAHGGGDGRSALEADGLALHGDASLVRDRASIEEDTWDDRSVVQSTFSELGSTTHLEYEIPDAISVASVISENSEIPALPKAQDLTPQQGPSDSGDGSSETFEETGPGSLHTRSYLRDGFPLPGIAAAFDVASWTGACAGTASLSACSDSGSNSDDEPDPSARQALVGKDDGSLNGVPRGALDTPRGPGGSVLDEVAGGTDGGLLITTVEAALGGVSGGDGRPQKSTAGVSEIQPLSSPDVAVRNDGSRGREPVQLELEKDADVEGPALNLFGMGWPDDGTLMMWGGVAAVAVGVVSVAVMASTGRPRFR